jgi:hypothetical protein
MLRSTKELSSYKLAALDGDMGHVKDFYFDDKNWVIRYMIVDTGAWLSGRLVLLSPHAFGNLNQVDKTLGIKLLKKQIEESPSIDSRKPVSRQHEMEYFRYYGWPAYWDGGAMWGPGSYPIDPPPSTEEMTEYKKYHHRDDKHLRSAQAVTGYEIQAVAGTIGHVSSFMVDDRSWEIRELVVETGHWYSGKEILIPPGKVERISYDESKVFVSLTKEDIERTEQHEIAHHVA